MTTTTSHPILKLAHAGLTALEQLEAELKADGFTEGIPDHITRGTISLDEQVLAETTCDCGRRGLALVPYHKAGTLGYRCIAVCIGPAGCLDAWEY